MDGTLQMAPVCTSSNTCFLGSDGDHTTRFVTIGWFYVRSTAMRPYNSVILYHTRMWTNAERHGRPAEYRWRPLFNATKFGWRPLPECRAVILPRRETRWNLQGCSKLPNGSQPLVGRSSQSGCVLLFRKFFPIVDTCLSCKDIARQSCAMVRKWRFFGDFLRPVFSASHVLFKTWILNSH